MEEIYSKALDNACKMIKDKKEEILSGLDTTLGITIKISLLPDSVATLSVEKEHIVKEERRYVF